jgi:hypothetical protein
MAHPIGATWRKTSSFGAQPHKKTSHPLAQRLQYLI